jgi:DtxR family Mn-dependent transcriptional regulator
MPQKDTLQKSSVENFLKAVYQLQEGQTRVRTNALAEALDIKASSAHDFINRCAEEGLVDYKSHQGVLLTEPGRQIALQVLRKHRLLELYLVTALGYTWDEVHEEAERLEHHISEKLAARIASVLGNPTVDPHGDPIPSLDGSVMETGLVKLEEMPPHSLGVVRRLLDQSADNLRYLAGKGLILGAQVRVLEREPFDGLTHIEVDGQIQIIGATTARFVMLHHD